MERQRQDVLAQQYHFQTRAPGIIPAIANTLDDLALAPSG